MPVYKVFMEYNRPMYGEFYLGLQKGIELDDVWWINEAGESIERPIEPETTQLELF